MIDRRSVTLLLGAVAVLPAAFFADIEPLTRGLVATALVLSGAIIGVTGEEWGSLARRCHRPAAEPLRPRYVSP